MAVHAHSRAVVTLSVPVPPAAGTESVVEPIVTPQRVTVEGAVAVVLDDEPHAASTAAAAAIITRVRDRMASEGFGTNSTVVYAS